MPVAGPEERALVELVREAEAAGRGEEAVRLAEERLEMGRRRLGLRPAKEKSSIPGFTSGDGRAILRGMEAIDSVPRGGGRRRVAVALEAAMWRFAQRRQERRRRQITEQLRDLALIREIAAAHNDPGRRAVIREEALREELRLLREAREAGGWRQALAALHPASPAARMVGVEIES